MDWPIQSNALPQMFSAPAPDPSVTRPPKELVKEMFMLLGVS
ncbi:MAG: hypothetical protein AB7V27_12085 [Candidatus Binatia bacterium]